MTRLPISVCMISASEAHRIGTALASVAGWTSEIVVVLNEDVVDGTDTIAAKFGAKVFREPWNGHIAQKNSAAQKAVHPWILGLDADEAVSAALKAELARLFARPSETERYAAYSFPRCTFYCGRWIRHGDWYPDPQTRLWQRGRAQWSGVDPHDKLLVEGTVGKLRADLHHFSNPTITHYLQKVPYYADLYLQRQLTAGVRWSAPTVIARSLWRFFRAYLFRLGFLDGYPGFFIAFSTAYATLFRHTRLYEHQQPAYPPCHARDSR